MFGSNNPTAVLRLAWYGLVRWVLFVCSHYSLQHPGVTVYPDWFHPDVQEYWNNEFTLFYNPEDGLDIDGVWIDMNEPANVSLFCRLACTRTDSCD